jgi:hypothetical protein
MAVPNAESRATFQLPVLVASTVDVGRLIREIENIDDVLHQLGLRKSGSNVQIPQTSHLMDLMVQLNKLNLLQETDRTALLKFLTAVRDRAPRLHVSFSADPNVTFIEKLMVWLRKEINPYLLLTIGLQPNIAAGCIVRSANKYFDLSLRQDFANKRELLLGQLMEATQIGPAPAVAPTPPVAISAPVTANAEVAA